MSHRDELDFTNVDSMAASSRAVRSLDLIGAHPAVIELRGRAILSMGLSAGYSILDLGCGTGEVARQFAEKVGPTGKVVAIDRSEAMIAEAKLRTTSDATIIDFQTGDALALDLSDNAFHGAWSERLFQHLEAPERALSEMIRVTKPGGKIVVIDTDWETFVIDHPDRKLTKQISSTLCSAFRKASIGRSLISLFSKNGLENVIPFGAPVSGTELASFSEALGLSELLGAVVQNGLATADEVDAWFDYLREADKRKEFFFSVTMFGACGQNSYAK